MQMGAVVAIAFLDSFVFSSVFGNVGKEYLGPNTEHDEQVIRNRLGCGTFMTSEAFFLMAFIMAI